MTTKTERDAAIEPFIIDGRRAGMTWRELSKSLTTPPARG